MEAPKYRLLKQRLEFKTDEVKNTYREGGKEIVVASPIRVVTANTGL